MRLANRRHCALDFLRRPHILKVNSPIRYDEVWDAFKKGSRTAFSSIYQQHAPLLFIYGSKICLDKALVEDSIQDLFVDLWNSRTNVVRTTSVKFYLFKALRYKLYRNMGQNGSMEPLGKNMWRLHSLSSEADSFDLDEESLAMKRLNDALSALPVRQREAIDLRYFQRFSNEEIARIMNISYRSACKCIYAALKKLNEHLSVPVMDMLLFPLALPCLGPFSLL